jgi:hypothetical protein
LTDKDYTERADFAFGDDRYFVGEPCSVYVRASPPEKATPTHLQHFGSVRKLVTEPGTFKEIQQV